MSDLKKQLLKLGNTNPELRPHLREVLADLDKEAKRVQVSGEVRTWYASLEKFIGLLDEMVDQNGVSFLDNRYAKRTPGNVIVAIAMVLLGGLANHILEDLEIPKKDLKKLERALQIVQKMRRMPNKPGTWWEKNRRHIEVIYNTRTYQTRDDEDSSLSFDLRGFTVFNTIQAEGQEMDEIRDLIERSIDAMKRSKIPVVPKLLYGKLKIVGKIQKSNTLAWYNLKNDDVSVRTRISSALDASHSLIHELGHRWWNRFLSSDVQRRWKTHHRRVGAKESDYPMPDVGDPLGIAVSKIGKNPIVAKVLGRAPYRQFYLEGTDAYIKESSLQRAFKKKNYPTLYAASDHEEHFCESFAMYVLGTLHQDHRDAFEEIVLGIEPAAQTVVPVVEEVTEPVGLDEGFLTEEAARQLLLDIQRGVSQEKDLVRASELLEGGSDETGLEALGLTLDFEIETTESRVPYYLTLTLDLDEETLELDVDPKTFDYSIDKVKADLKGKSADDLTKYIVRLLNDYEEDLVEMTAPGSRIVKRPKKVRPSSDSKQMSKDSARDFLEDVIKIIGKNKRISTATKPMIDRSGVVATIGFEMDTSTGVTPYELNFSLEGDVLTLSAAPEVFEGNIENKRMTLNSSLTSELVAKSIVSLLARYEDGLYDMVSF